MENKLLRSRFVKEDPFYPIYQISENIFAYFNGWFSVLKGKEITNYNQATHLVRKAYEKYQNEGKYKYEK